MVKKKSCVCVCVLMAWYLIVGLNVAIVSVLNLRLCPKCGTRCYFSSVCVLAFSVNQSHQFKLAMRTFVPLKLVAAEEKKTETQNKRLRPRIW